MTVIAQSGNITLDQAIDKLVKSLKSSLDTRSAKPLAEGARDAIRAHLAFAHPGSKHFSPSKVNAEKNSRGNVGEVDVDIPGISRAYHDIDIFPKSKRSLTIPLHREAYGVKATSFNDLFVVKKKNGNAFLAKNDGGDLKMMYLLRKHVHQAKDTSLMPSDDNIATVQFSRLKMLVNDIADEWIDTI